MKTILLGQGILLIVVSRIICESLLYITFIYQKVTQSTKRSQGNKEFFICCRMN